MYNDMRMPPIITCNLSVLSLLVTDFLATYSDLLITMCRLIECTIQLCRRNSNFGVDLILE